MKPPRVGGRKAERDRRYSNRRYEDRRVDILARMAVRRRRDPAVSVANAERCREWRNRQLTENAAEYRAKRAREARARRALKKRAAELEAARVRWESRT